MNRRTVPLWTFDDHSSLSRGAKSTQESTRVQVTCCACRMRNCASRSRKVHNDWNWMRSYDWQMLNTEKECVSFPSLVGNQFERVEEVVCGSNNVQVWAHVYCRRRRRRMAFDQRADRRRPPPPSPRDRWAKIIDGRTLICVRRWFAKRTI